MDPIDERDDEGWRGRFPKNEIISLLDVNRPLNLAESTSRDLELGELLELVGGETLSHLRLGYGPSAGTPALREVIAESVGVPAEHVLTTQGTALGLFMLAFEVCRPGDEVVVVTPCFPPSRDALIGCGLTVKPAALSFDDRYRLDPERLAPLLSARTRLVSLASPQNPSGICTPEPAIRRLLEIMTEAAPDALLFVDETYREASYGDAPTRPSVAGLAPRVITGASVSKAHGAPGLRVGWLTVADAALRERLKVAKLNMVISVSVLDEALAAGLLRRREAVLAPRRALLAQGLDLLAQWREREQARVDWVRPDAGALCCLRLRADAFSEAGVERFWRSLPAHDLQLAAGTWFGGSARELRLGFGYLPVQRLPRALSALSRAMDEAQPEGGRESERRIQLAAHKNAAREGAAMSQEPASPDAYIHGTAPEEQARLAALNRLTNRAFVEFLGVDAGARVLEVGSGLGLLAAEVADSAADVRVVGIERSPAQIAAAVRSPNVRYLEGDAHALAFPDASFDVAYARYLLEHVSRPDVVLAELRRVVRPGGRVAVCENDISLLRVDPACPAFEAVWGAFQDYQRSLGGDARVGTKLYRLMRGAGFSRIELSVLPEVHWHGSPNFAACVENIVGNVEGARAGLIGAGYADAPLLERAGSELRALMQNPDASSVFIWNRAMAVR